MRLETMKDVGSNGCSRFAVSLRLLLLVALLTCGMNPVLADDSGLKETFVFDQWRGPSIRAFYTIPAGLDVASPVVIVMHGMSRTAAQYHQVWDALARQHGFIVIVPEFTDDAFPGSRNYNLGNTFDEKGRQVDRKLWSFSAIELLFDAFRERFELNAERYSIYGHSAGAQFVHRFLMHIPNARVDRAVIANAGWYTLPDFEIDWPYGLKGSQVPQDGLKRLLGMELTVLLGDEDIDTRDDSLRRSPEALKQGPHRLARGYYYIAAGRFAASQLQLPIEWKLGTVHGANHDNARMAPSAVQFLLAD